jgi:flagellar hook assembly protein FlgD
LLRKAVISVLVLGAGVVPALAGAAPPVRGQTLMPGVIYSRDVEFTAHGPVVVNVIAAPRPTGLFALKAILSNNAVQGTERVTSMQRRYSDEATVVGVNAPNGGMIRDGVLDIAPAEERSTVGVDTAGTIDVERVDLEGTWQGSGQRRILGINEAPRGNRTTLYTRAWGARTPAESGGAFAILQPFPASKPNLPLTTTVTGYAQGGNQPIPADGAVLVARGSQAGFLSAEAPVGSKVTVNLTLTPPWTNVPYAVGGGPVIVRGGKPVFRSFENFTPEGLAQRNARSAVGQTKDGDLILVTVDGRQPGYSTGLTNFELALAMMRLGCVTAMALDSGPAATMAFDGKLLNRPASRGVERPVPAALTLFYYGVYAPSPTNRVLSPNSDGDGDTLALSYKLVRPSTVSATLNGPGGVVVSLDSGSRAPGVYPFNWNGAGQPEGAWTFRVSATDDAGAQSTADRQFTLNNTLGSLAVRVAGKRATASFKLSRVARVTGRIETSAGAVVRTLPARNLPAGDSSIAWNGRAGRYIFSVTATNSVGDTELTAPFRLRG